MRNKIFANFKMFRIYGTRNVSIRGGTYILRIEKIELLILVKKQPFFSVKYFFKNDKQPKKTVGEMCVYGEAYILKIKEC
jgi:hypothetical protein